ncbi:MAG TPA: CSLREA domain-containing protein [Anaerolineae bacterium]|nr:CSLREA domain-containing protein [Anaerolineae bacterium]
MPTQLRSRPLSFVLVAIGFALIILILANHSSLVHAASNTYVVNSTDDLPDADPGDAGGICADANGKCTLRAAIMQANFTTDPNTITLPSGVYVLTRQGYDDSASSVTLESLTIRNGNVPTSGVAGASWGGGILLNNLSVGSLTLHLSDVILEETLRYVRGHTVNSLGNCYRRLRAKEIHHV